jgi:hypothetical protein
LGIFVRAVGHKILNVALLHLRFCSLCCEQIYSKTLRPRGCWGLRFAANLSAVSACLLGIFVRAVGHKILNVALLRLRFCSLCCEQIYSKTLRPRFFRVVKCT